MIKISDIEEYYQNKYEFVAGVDEVGRGSLAGPVVAAAVILPKNFDFNEISLTDSKKLSAKKREQLNKVICESAISFSVGIIDNHIIDELNILKATLIAMNKAIESLKIKPDFLLIDGNYFSGNKVKHLTVIKGDEKCPSISAASIVAKVYRDKYMTDVCHVQYPQYGFDKNKGYGVRSHIEAIKRYGISEFHRKSFLNKFLTDTFKNKLL
jgi:ribonuclease HII